MMYSEAEVWELLRGYTSLLSIVFNVVGLVYLFIKDRVEIIVCGLSLFFFNILLGLIK